MPFAHRFSIEGLTDKLEIEIAALMKKHPQGIVIRLHVLGDFYSVEYVKFWERMLFEFPELCIFGYTGRELDSPIGSAIHLLNIRYGERFVVRYSRNNESTEMGKWFAAEESFDGKHFECPEQTGKLKDCASCGLCWTVQNTVRFATHQDNTMKDYPRKLDQEEIEILEQFNLEEMFPDYTIEDAIVKGILKQILSQTKP